MLVELPGPLAADEQPVRVIRRVAVKEADIRAGRQAAAVIIDDGPTERQLMDWNIANDHAEDGDGLDYDRDYEAE